MSLQLYRLALIVLFMRIFADHYVTSMPFQTTDPMSRSSGPYVKRLCNTFGGCGSKRSLSPSSLGVQDYGIQNQVGITDESNSSSSRSSWQASQARKELRDALVTEILNELLEHLQNNERYRQGDYIMIVPKQAIIDEKESKSIDFGSKLPQPSDLQELRV